MPERIARRNLLPVPPGLAPEVAAMTEPLACCLHGVDVAGVEHGDSVAVVGPGPIGLMLCACVADAGGRPVVVGGRPERRELASLFGAVPDEPRRRRRRDRGGGDGRGVASRRSSSCDPAAPCSPSAACRATRASRSTRTASTTRRCRLVGAFHHTPRHIRAALGFLASDAYPFERLVTHRVGLEGVAGLFADPPDDLLKAAVVP